MFIFVVIIDVLVRLLLSYPVLFDSKGYTGSCDGESNVISYILNY